MTAPSIPDADEAQERRAVADPLVGMVVAERYRILSVLGVGGMGVVYKVEHVHIGKLMAMKLLSGALSRDPVVIKRFKREALAASRLSHPNTVQVFDFGQANNLTYLVMELVPGEDLARVLRLDGPLAVGRVVRLMVQVCGSLAEAHAAGIVHRDLKPENVMLVRSRDGKDELPKVCDFGVAKLRGGAEGTNDATQDRAVVGTPYYMAPEQIRGEEVDARADVYAIGAMMYRLLTAQPPFEGANPMAVFAKHLTESPRPPSERAPDAGIPRSVDAIVLRAMAKNRDNRFASVEAMQADLFDVLRAGNTSSVDLLVDAGHIERLAADLTQGTSPSQPAIRVRKTATRDEVAAYERKLNRQRRLGQVLLAGALVGGVVTLGVLARKARGYVEAQALPPVLPEGIESEPNDDAARANRVAFGREVRGQIGKRLAADRSDRDFFAFDVPAGVDRAQLRLTALPNFATCLWLYRSGTADPLARFCSGAPRQDFTLASYVVEPGRYLLAVLQDTDGHGGDSPPVHENVSDFYTLSFGPAAQADELAESEPNDSPMTARRLAPGAEARGSLNFSNDEDVLCPKAGTTGPVRWVLRDAGSLGRPTGTALEATVDRGSLKDGLRLVVHRAGSVAPGRSDGVQVVSPHSTPAFKLDGAPTTGCLKLRLTRDPWAQGPGVREPLPSDEPYVVKLEAL